MSGNNETGRAATAAVVAFVLSALASVALMAVYIAGGQPQAEGLLIGVSLGGIGAGLIVWAKELMPPGGFVEERRDLTSTAAGRAALDAEMDDALIARRSFLAKALTGALGALGLAAVFPIRSLGDPPGQSLFHTAYKAGTRLVTADGAAVTSADLELGSILTVYPEGATDRADSQAVAIRVEPGELHSSRSREGWAPEGVVVYSKICTHAGCPVGLYEPTSHELLCPCHQSAFDVTREAVPTAGPATRPLPQLPIEIDASGYLVARGDFSSPVGPGFWNI